MNQEPNNPTQANSFLVTDAARRPASDAPGCFYCQQPIGMPHKAECVLVQKRVRIRVIVEYEVAVPAHWDKGMIEFNRNDGSRCANNALDELKDLAEREGCLCEVTRFEYLSDASDPYLNEQ